MSEVFKQRPVFKELHNLLSIPLPVNHPVDFKGAAPEKVSEELRSGRVVELRHPSQLDKHIHQSDTINNRDTFYGLPVDLTEMAFISCPEICTPRSYSATKNLHNSGDSILNYGRNEGRVRTCNGVKSLSLTDFFSPLMVKQTVKSF
jgi:hypothetical protein